MKSALWISFVLLAIAAPASGADRPYSGIVAFGGSLSDSGNLFALTGGLNLPPAYDVDTFLIPSSAYARGGHYLTNGDPWIVRLGRSLGLATSVQPAFRAGTAPAAADYAVAGARARDDGINVNLADQLSRFSNDRGGIAGADDLYVIDFGGNDVNDALRVFVAGGNPFAVLDQAAVALGQGLQQLRQMGATRFLILSVPDIGQIPAVALQGVAAQQLASGLTQYLNASIDAVVATTLGSAHVTRLDLFTRLHYIVAHPAEFGFTNVTDACITPDEPPFTCKRPDEYVFWDGIHPTKAVHAILAHDAEQALGL